MAAAGEETDRIAARLVMAVVEQLLARSDSP